MHIQLQKIDENKNVSVLNEYWLDHYSDEYRPGENAGGRAKIDPSKRGRGGGEIASIRKGMHLQAEINNNREPEGSQTYYKVAIINAGKKTDFEGLLTETKKAIRKLPEDSPTRLAADIARTIIRPETGQ